MLRTPRKRRGRWLQCYERTAKETVYGSDEVAAAQYGKRKGKDDADAKRGAQHAACGSLRVKADDPAQCGRRERGDAEDGYAGEVSPQFHLIKISTVKIAEISTAEKGSK